MSYKIDYIEFWATGHCNLNCKGCSSCSPIAQEWYLDTECLSKDLQQLKRLEIDIDNITILGGEPLMHPDLVSVMQTVNNVYPMARLGIITNGFLLLKMPQNFWMACVKYNIKINVTCFPIMDKSMINEIEKLLKSKELEYRIIKKRWFNKILTQNNKEPFNKIVSACGCKKAYNLKSGGVARCTVPMAMPLLNNKFNAGMVESGILNIYEAQSGSDVIAFLNTPNESCKNCSAKPIKVEWEKADSNPQLADWII